MMRDKRRVAVVVGSGGIKCAASLGLWQVLKREAIEVSMAVGSSGGSIYAALMALGYEAADAEALTVNLWTADLMSGYTSQLRAVQSGESRFTERSGLADGQQLTQRLVDAFGDQTFADTRFPLYVVSTDLYSGEPVIHSTGRVWWMPSGQALPSRSSSLPRSSVADCWWMVRCPIPCRLTWRSERGPRLCWPWASRCPPVRGCDRMPP